MKKLFQKKRNRIIVFCLSFVCMSTVFMNRKAFAWPFIHTMVNGVEKTYELYSHQTSKQYATSDFSNVMKAEGKDFSGSSDTQYAVDTQADHILRVYCAFMPFMFSTCDVGSSALGVYVISSDGRTLQKF